MSGHRLLVLGGARSGKSRLAQSRAEELGGNLIYVATAEAWDDEMRERIALHQADRDGRWSTLEAPLDLAAAIAARSAPGATLLVDCLTLWATNVMLAERELEAEIAALTEAVRGFRGTLILVANEVGLGIVPDNALARRFRDFAGRLNQAVAAVADEVVFVAAGLPLRLK